MKSLGLKATLYDLLGYIIPGLLFESLIYSSYLFMIKIPLQSIVGKILEIEISKTGVTLILLSSYLLGHILSCVGSLLFENRFVRKHDNEESDDFDARKAVGICQEKYPKIYDTAFIFLSIYGFSRSVLVAIFFAFLINWNMNGFQLSLSVIVLLLCIVLFLNYRRFKNYYLEQLKVGVDFYNMKI